jgi:hypothetical protein
MLKNNLLQNINKIVFNSNIALKKRIKIRDNLQYKFPEYIFSFNSDNNLIVTKFRK